MVTQQDSLARVAPDEFDGHDAGSRPPKKRLKYTSKAWLVVSLYCIVRLAIRVVYG